MTWSVVTFRGEKFHSWPGARKGREYLKLAHRHLMHVRVAVAVDGSVDRQVEYHDLLDYCEGVWQNVIPRDSHWSCEKMADRLAKEVAKYYDTDVRVSVFEDGECGAEVERRRDDVRDHKALHV